MKGCIFVHRSYSIPFPTNYSITLKTKIMSSGKVLLGVLAGAAIGAGIGILFAPDKGSETRKKIVDRSNEYADGLGDKISEFFEAITEKFETVKEDALHFTENGKQVIHDFENDLTTVAKKY